MNRFGISDKSYSLLMNYFASNKNIEEVIIFGSRAMGNYKKGSDIDIAIKGKNLQPLSVFNIASFLNEELPIPYKIDVVDYNFINHPELKAHIETVGVSISRV